MHPVLASYRRLTAYLLAWGPVLALLAYGAPQTPGAAWAGFASVLAPVCALFAFVCLSPWPICRSWPLSPGQSRGHGRHVGRRSRRRRPHPDGRRLAGRILPAAGGATAPARLLFAMGTLLYLLSAGLHYAVLAAQESREAERRAAEARTLAREAELQALRIQLNPHFLFNSLHSISALATVDGPRAREMCIRLADFLRGSLGLGERETIPLEEELALARRYLEVEQVRFGGRLEVQEAIDPDCEHCGVPALAAAAAGGKCRQAWNGRPGGRRRHPAGGASPRQASVAILVENAFDPEAAAGRSLGLGLRNVRRRLRVRYGEEAELEAGPAGDRYRVSLRLPCESPIASSSRA